MAALLQHQVVLPTQKLGLLAFPIVRLVHIPRAINDRQVMEFDVVLINRERPAF